MSLTDEQWGRVAVFLVEGADGSRQGVTPARRIFEAILWVRDNGEEWANLPASFPAQQTCYNRWLKWRKSGALDAAFKVMASAGW